MSKLNAQNRCTQNDSEKKEEKKNILGCWWLTWVDSNLGFGRKGHIAQIFVDFFFDQTDIGEILIAI